MTTVLAFIVTIGLLVAVHEYGHFQMARWCGVKVLKFSLGFGKPLWVRHFGRDNTQFIIAAFPLGGYVKMLDEREGPVEPAEQARAFNRQAVWKRMLIVLAGPTANLLLAIGLYAVIFMHGIEGLRPVLGDVPRATAAAHAGLSKGDVVQAVGDATVTTWQDLRWALLEQALEKGSVPVSALQDGRVNIVSLNLGGLDKDDFEADFLAKLGLNPFRPDMPPVIGEIMAGSTAETSGLKPGDRIVSVNGRSIAQWEDFVDLVRTHPGVKLDVRVSRHGTEQSILVVPQSARENGKNIGRIGAAYRTDAADFQRYLVTVQYPPLQALNKAIDKTWDTSVFSLKMLANMLTGDVSWRGVSGPVTIASYAGQSAQIGWKAFVGFLALVSISLGVLNLLPIPVLDGGHLLYYIVEFLKGSPVSEQVMEAGQRVGLALLGLLMACALFNDIHRLITG